MDIRVTVRLETILMGAVAVVAGSGIGPLIYDLRQASQNCTDSRIAKLVFDILMCIGTGMAVAGFSTANASLMMSGVAVYGGAILIRSALSIFSKVNGEPSEIW